MFLYTNKSFLWYQCFIFLLNIYSVNVIAMEYMYIILRYKAKYLFSRSESVNSSSDSDEQYSAFDGVHVISPFDTAIAPSGSVVSKVFDAL